MQIPNKAPGAGGGLKTLDTKRAVVCVLESELRINLGDENPSKY